MKINGYVVPGTLAIAIIVGAVAYGEQSSTVSDHDRRIETLEKTPLKVWEIDKRQVGMNAKIEALTRAQETFRDQTERSLDRILRKLDE